MRVREDFYPEHYLDAVTPSPIQESGGLVKDYIYGCTGRRGATIPWPEEGAAVMGDPSAPGAGCDPPVGITLQAWWHGMQQRSVWGCHGQEPPASVFMSLGDGQLAAGCCLCVCLCSSVGLVSGWTWGHGVGSDNPLLACPVSQCGSSSGCSQGKLVLHCLFFFDTYSFHSC